MIFYIIIIILILLLKSFILKNKSFSKFDPKRPFPALPLIGHLHLLANGLPHMLLDDIGKKLNSKSIGLYFGDKYNIIINCPILAREIHVKNSENFSERISNVSLQHSGGVYQGKFYPEYHWRDNKKKIAPTFAGSKIKKSLPIIENQCINLLNLFEKNANQSLLFNPRHYVKTFSLNIVLKIVFGMEMPFDESQEKNEKLENFFKASDHLLKQMESGNIGDFIDFFSPIYRFYLKYFNHDVEKMNSFISYVYKEHLESFNPNSPPRDLIDSLILDLGPDDPETLERIKYISQEVLVAGTDTSASTIEWFMILLSNNPNIQEKVFLDVKQVYDLKINNKFDSTSLKMNLEDRAQTKYLNATIKEVLRLKPPVPLGFPKEAKEDILINNELFIPKGTQIIQNTYSINRDSDHWNNPNEFLPERFLSDQSNIANIPFSIGSRSCVGMILAQDELYMILSNLILNFKISSPQPINELEENGITLHSQPFKIILSKRV